MTGRLPKVRVMLALVRADQYFKNLLVFAPLFFAGEIARPALFDGTLTAFAGFCAVASAVYIINDCLDMPHDINHPVKRNRPIAAGQVSKSMALAVMALMAVSGFILTGLTGKTALLFLACYFIVNVAYSCGLKNLPVADVLMVALGFVLRLFTGSAASGIRLSFWIVVMTFLLALFIAVSKRRDDIITFLQTGNKPRKAIEAYSLEVIDAGMVVLSVSIMAAYAAYTVCPGASARTASPNLYLTGFFVAAGIMRYMQLIYLVKKRGSPASLLMRDPFMQATLAGWMLTFSLILYW